jgi:gliding motility-associated-like protein
MLSLKKIFFFLSFFVFSSGLLLADNHKHPSSDQNAKTPGSNWTAGTENFPGNIQAFEENKGQYLNPVNAWKVQYACMNNGSYIRFSENGIIYSVPLKKEPDFKNAGKEEDAESEEEEEANGPDPIKYQNVIVEWTGANPHPQIIQEEQTPFYFGSADLNDLSKDLGRIKGYRKLLYKDVYPGIDVEFSFHPQQGIKYTIIAKPGSDVSQFCMHYSGQTGLLLDASGNLHVQTSGGDILDHAPLSLSSTGNTIASSFQKKGKDEICFQVDPQDAKTGIVIDPWVLTPPAGTAKFVPSNVAIDGANNTYILGYDSGTKLMYLQQYNPAGTFVWTYTFNEYPGLSWESDLAVDLAGNSYVGGPKGFVNAGGQNYAMACIAPGGTRTYFNTAYTGTDVYELLNEAYDCSTSTLIQAGSGLAPTTPFAKGNTSNVAGVAPATGAIGTVFNQPTTGEVFAGCIAPNGNYYCIAADSNAVGVSPTQETAGAFDNLICFTVAGTTVTKSWQMHIDYKFIDYNGKAGPNNLGLNGVAASCAFLYTSDGTNLDQRNLATGALIKRVAIPGGVTCGTCGIAGGTWGHINSGLTVDLKCGYVYAGSVNNMYCFDANLNPVFTYAGIPGIVYGVYYNNGLVSVTGATAANVGFVTQFAAQVCVPNITHVNPTCGKSNGSATITPTFCAAPYTYLWTPSGQTTATATNLPAGLYTVNVGTNSSCVTVADTVTLISSTGGTETIAGVNEKCAGGNNGSATVTMTGGTAPFTYTWAPAPAGGQGTITATGLTAGTYTCTVPDNGGCTTTQTIVITEPVVLTAPNTQTNVTCNGGSNGTASVIPAGGTVPYTYSWSPAPASGVGATASALTAGTYTCTVTDSHACTVNSVVTITQPVPVTATATSTPALCGSANGSATVTPASGIGAYTYSWNPGAQTTQTAAALAGGLYTCTVTDANGCTVSATTTVGTTGGPTLVLNAPTNVTCFGLCNGALGVTATGGTAPLTYSWTPAPAAGQGTANATALCAGTYTSSVTDSKGCLSSITGIVTQPPVLTVATVPTNVSCFGKSDGTVTGNAGGGTGPYTYTWNPVPAVGQGTSSATGLPAATYTLTVNDANACTQTSSAPVTQPALLSVNAAGIAATCNAKCDGQLICIPAGGTSSYTYSWNTGCVAASCNAVCTGTYTVTITDAHGCLATDTALVNQPPALVLTLFPKASICNKADGSDSVSVAGGSPGYSYLWNPAGSTTGVDGHILAGNYTVTVTDNHGCTKAGNNVVPNLPGVNIFQVSSTNVTCNGGSDGSAKDSVSGGYKPYTFVWTPAPGGGQNTLVATGLAAGSYTCTVTDSAGCVNSVAVPITQPTLVTVTTSPAATICYGSCTDLTAQGTGGTPGYTYSWTSGGITSPTHVCPTVQTIYTVSCTDSKNCPVSATITISVNPLLEVLASGGGSICPGKSAQLSALGSGGNGGPYTYVWSPTTGLSNPNIINPVATPAVTTTYTVIVSDNCGTPTDSATTTVTVFPAPVVNFTSKDTVKCAPVCVAFVGTSVPGCASASWDFGDGTTGGTCGTANHCYFKAGNYAVTYNVTDVDGCIGSQTISNFINALPVPVAAFSADPQPATILNPVISFTDQSTPAPTIVSWAWNFGDLTGATSILQNPKYTYGDTGCYIVQLSVVANDGCTDVVKHPVCIDPDFTFYAPNAFTPNNDGKNDEWMPYGIGIDPKNYHLMLFDRWGNLMFETHTWGQGWDGRANNGSAIAQIDTYVWKVDLKDVMHNKHNYVGHVSIIK